MYPEDTTHKEENFLVEIIRFTIIALLIVIPIRIFVAQPFIVQGASMEPTFETGQYLIVDQLSYRLEAPTRGDVIVFRYPKDPKKFFIKRIIGLPGETITIDRTTVSITNSQNPNGFVLDEPYIDSMNPDTLLTQELGENEYFVMGDNRDASSDSRVWGTLNEDLIIGRALIRLLPVSTMEILPGELEQPLSTDAK
ncbi:signal peptidase I [Patescibacteria group bacterium]|nr:signal peptidase I [Patescibacteria group bacterium]